MRQEHYARKKRNLRFLSEKLQKLLANGSNNSSVKVQELVLSIRQRIHQLTHVLTQFDLKRTLGTAAVLFGISFTGQVAAQTFAAPQVNPFGLDTNAYGLALPAFADLDNDGDMDLFIGQPNGTMAFYENTGTATAPQFATPQQNPFGLSSTPVIPAPAFADLDNDGDLDLLVGQDYGVMRYFQNTGTATSPQFASVVLANPFGLISVNLTSNLVFPTFADLDNDGDQDLFVGESSGVVRYFENTGTASDPQFSAPLASPFGIEVFSGAIDLVPEFADLDLDGDLDLLLGYGGNFKYAENTGSVSAPQFASAQTNPFGLTATYDFAIPAATDLDDDGDIDILAGEAGGALQYFENTDITGIANREQNLNINLYPNPVSDILRMETEEKINSVEISDVLGKTVMRVESPVRSISLSTLNPGIYMVKIINEKGSAAVRRIRKQ